MKTKIATIICLAFAMVFAGQAPANAHYGEILNNSSVAFRFDNGAFWGSNGTVSNIPQEVGTISVVGKTAAAVSWGDEVTVEIDGRFLCGDRGAENSGLRTEPRTFWSACQQLGRKL